MRSAGIALLKIFFSLHCSFFCKAQLADHKDVKTGAGIDTTGKPANCKEASSAILLNSLKEKDDWQIVSGPALPGMHYPVQAYYTKPFPSWEMDRYTADSSYFKNCDWMILPDKRTVINTSTRLPIVFTKRFTTIAPSKLKLMVKMLYDNMAYLYIDSTWIILNHKNPDINRFIKKLQPELSNLVSIPALFNFSYNASFYAGDFYNLVLPAGEHIIRIELFNNAYELGCIIKGMLISGNGEKIFCAPPIENWQSELESILLFRDQKAFPKNKIADTVYAALMRSVKTGHWIDNMITGDRDVMSQDTLFMKKGDKINVSPAYITEFYNGNTDTVYAGGSLRKITAGKSLIKQWDKTFVFDALVRGTYWLEINCEFPADDKHTDPNILNKYARVIKVN
ncbi:MAG: hypothetical protein ABI707_04600 [Ferruginibacter sp.]